MTSIALSLTPTSLIGSAWDRSISKLTSFDLTGERDGASISLDQPRRELIEALDSVAADAGIDGWDDEGGLAVTASTIAQALAFIDVLPSTVNAPELSAHPDGEVAFYWSNGRRRMLTVSVASSGRLSFALLNGHRSLSGTEYLIDGLPESISLALRQIHSGDA